MGIGGAPEGVITAAALRCLGGEIQARFRYRNDEERARGAAMGHGDEDRVYHTEDLASGENLVFAATGVTTGDLLEGVRFFGGGARTHSLSWPTRPSRSASSTRSTCSTGIGRRRSDSERAPRPWPANGRIVAMGGGGFQMQPDNGRLDAFLRRRSPGSDRAATGRGSASSRPRRPTTRGWSRGSTARSRGRAEPSHLALFSRTVDGRRRVPARPGRWSSSAAATPRTCSRSGG